ncbi:PEP-CTERM sorting domain-containing protein [Oxalobacteraceae bacterium OTU3CINTB1]|nr:PEP-CTERM sorting domain-containing protein [Oxalobacteraceae bacterium OTU3CINTB1]
MRNLFFAICFTLASLFGGAAHAYQYNYISEVIPVEFTSIRGDFTYIQYSVITAHIFTPTLLTAGSTWAPGTQIHMYRFSENFAQQALIYPDPSADPTFPPGSVWNPNYTVTMNIGAVDANGLPTVFDISLQRQLRTPPGFEDLSNLLVSNTGDRAWGGYETYTTFNGAATMPGTWTMGAAPIPEPETYAMMLAGMALVGAVARRRSARRGSGLAI